MITQELMQAAMQDRMMEAARLQVEREARALPEDRSSVRRARVGEGRRLRLPSFVAHVLRSAASL